MEPSDELAALPHDSADKDVLVVQAESRMIDFLIPVRGRPANAQPLADSIRQNTTVPHSIIFVCSRGDTPQIDACTATKARVLLVDGGDYEYARKINFAASHETTDGEWLFLGADDLAFHPGWDEAALSLPATALVIGTNDLGNPTVMAGKHATHSLVHRSYIARGTIDEPGLLLHPGYQHNFVDNEFIATAKSRGVWAFAANSHVEHLHPFWRKSEDDQVYELGRRTYHADARTWRKRQRLLRAR